MIVDCHVHVKGGDLYHREFSAEQILRTMDEAGVDKSVIFAMSLPSRESNDLMYRVYQQAPERFIPFAHIVPTEGILSSLELTRALIQLGCRGVKVHLGELTQVSEEELAILTRRCVEAKIPLLIDVAGRLDISQFLASQMPDCDVIIAHLGSPHDERLVEKTIALAYEQSHIYLDCSYSFVPWKIAEAIDVLGSERVIWGSDGPIMHPAVELQKIRVLDLDQTAFENITCNNILRLTRADSGS